MGLIMNKLDKEGGNNIFIIAIIVALITIPTTTFINKFTDRNETIQSNNSFPMNLTNFTSSSLFAPGNFSIISSGHIYIDKNKCHAIICACAENTKSPCMVDCYECDD